jgi:HD-GYP domain-containing protein (c-di-GMP phosphodiesterase class II)
LTTRRIRLRGVSPEIKEQSWESDRPLRVGRSRDAEVLLEDTSLSRRHAELTPDETGWVLRDTGSTNGTFVNGTPVGRAGHHVRAGDLIQCGNVVLMVQELAEEHGPCETPVGRLQVQATAEQSWEQAVEMLAYDVTRRQQPGEQLLALLRAGQHLGGPACLDDLLRVGVRDAVVSLAARRGAIALLDETTDKLVVRAAFSTRPEAPTGRAFSSTLAQRCCQSGQSLLCADVGADLDLLRAPSVTTGEMSSVICALLRSPRRRLGVLHLDRSVSQPPFTPDDLRLADALAANMAVAIDNALQLQEKQRNLFLQTVLVLAQAIEMRDEYTGGHTQRVTDYALLLAEELKLPAADRQTLQLGAPLHDVGKIGVDDAVLRKPGRLTAAEYEQMKTHTVKGAAILGTIPDLAFVIPLARSHHERWDGKGYPDGLAGANIPQLARLLAVADTFDAMTSNRPYRLGLSADYAFAEIARGAGTQFDPDCAAAFLRLRPLVEAILHEQRCLLETGAAPPPRCDLRGVLAGAQVQSA